MRGGTTTTSINKLIRQNFNPPAPCGAGPCQITYYNLPWYFNPPAPCGAGRNSLPLSVVMLLFQSTRPVRGGTTFRPGHSAPSNFNPPAPCGAGLVRNSNIVRKNYFNPPAPCGAGLACHSFCQLGRDISIHPPRAGRDLKLCTSTTNVAISIHPPRAGRDTYAYTGAVFTTYFNPPAPCGAGHLFGEALSP